MSDSNNDTAPDMLGMAAVRMLAARLPADFSDPTARIGALSRIVGFVEQRTQQQQACAAPMRESISAKALAAERGRDFTPRALPAFADFQADLRASGDPAAFDRHWGRCGNDVTARRVTLEQTVNLLLTREVAADIAISRGPGRAADVINRIFADCETDIDYRASFRTAARAALGFLSPRPPVGQTTRAAQICRNIADRKTSHALAGLAARMEPGERIVPILGDFTVEPAALRRFRFDALPRPA